MRRWIVIGGVAPRGRAFSQFSQFQDFFLREDAQQAIYEKARARFLRGQADEGVKLLQELEKHNEDLPTRAAVVGLKGNGMMLCGRLDDAVEFYVQSLELNDTPSVRFNLLCLFVGLGRWGEALQMEDLFDEGEEFFHKAMLRFGNLLVQLDKMDEAAKRFERGSRSPKLEVKVECLIGRARVALWKSQTQEDLDAVELQYENIMKLIEKHNLAETLVNVEYLHNCGDFFCAKKNFERAKQLYEESLSLVRRVDPGGDLVLPLTRKFVNVAKLLAASVRDEEALSSLKDFEASVEEEMRKANTGPPKWLRDQFNKD